MPMEVDYVILPFLCVCTDLFWPNGISPGVDLYINCFKRVVSSDTIMYLYMVFWLRFTALHQQITTRSVGWLSLDIRYSLHRDDVNYVLVFVVISVLCEGLGSQSCKDS